MNDHQGAKLMFDALPPAPVLIADKGYDSDEFRAALISRGTTPCIPPRKNRKIQHAYCKTLYRQRHKVECMFGKLKDWRRVATRYDRCAHTLLLRHMRRRFRHLLSQSMSPDPRAGLV